jgi:hypothetical protein
MRKMKKLILLLLIPFFTGCKPNCVIAQIPAQVIYADKDCNAILPDYRNKVTIISGCSGYTLLQTPVPGYVLSSAVRSVTVILKVTATNNKSAQTSFPVTMIDTVTPQIVVSSAFVELQIQKINEVYNAADKMVSMLDAYFEKVFPYDSLGLTRPASEYLNKMLVTMSLDSAGVRRRVSTYADTIQMPIRIAKQ